MGKKRHKKGWSCRHGNYKEIDKKEELRRFRGFQACTPIISERESLRQSNGLSLRCFLSLLLSNTLSLYLFICTLLFQSIYSILLSDCLLYIRCKFISSKRRVKKRRRISLEVRSKNYMFKNWFFYLKLIFKIFLCHILILKIKF
jgi:hypothetical protein